MAVTKLEITERGPFAGGQPFGEAGPYEFLLGTVHIGVDPGHPHSRKIVDLGRVPPGFDGRVHF